MSISPAATAHSSSSPLTSPPFCRPYQRQVKKSTTAKLKRKAVFTSSESDEDVPLASPVKQVKSKAVPMPGALDAVKATTSAISNGRKRNGHANGKSLREESDSSDTNKKTTKAKTKGKPAKKKPKVESEDESSYSGDDEPLAKPKAKPKTNGKGKGKAKVRKESDEDAMDVDIPPKKKAKEKVKEENGKAKATPEKKKVESGTDSPQKKKEDEEEVFRWWEAPADVMGDGSVKWKTLEHNGVLFPPLYTPLPSDVKMKYLGALCPSQPAIL